MPYIKITLVTITVLAMSMLHLSHAANVKSSMTVPDPMSLVLIGIGVLGVGIIGWWRRGN